LSIDLGKGPHRSLLIRAPKYTYLLGLVWEGKGSRRAAPALHASQDVGSWDILSCKDIREAYRTRGKLVKSSRTSMGESSMDDIIIYDTYGEYLG